MGIMNRAGVTVFLDGDPELLADRTIRDETDKNKPTRPLVYGLNKEARVQKFQGLLEKRKPIYEQANIIVTLRDKSIETIVEEILAGMQR